MIRFLLMLALLAVAGCTPKADEDDADASDEAVEEAADESGPTQSNPIKEFVNTPKEAARGVARKVESKQTEAASEARRID